MKNKILDYIYLKDQKLLIIIIFVAIGLSAVIGYFTPIFISDLYQSYKVQGATDKAIMGLVFLFISEYFISILYQLALNKYIQKLLEFIRNRSYSSWIHTLEVIDNKSNNENKYPLGEVLSRVLTDTEAVIELVSSGSFKIFIDFAFIISCLISFIRLNTVSGIALISVEVLACILLVIGSQKMSVVYMAVRKSTGIMSRVIANLAGGFRFSYFHPNFKYASRKGYDSFEDFLQKQLVANVWDAGYFSIAESLFPILLAMLVFIFPYSHITELALIATIVDLIQRSISPIKEISGKISGIQRAKTGIIRIEEFNRDLALKPKSDANVNHSFSRELKKFSCRIDDFSYKSGSSEKDFRLTDISFDAYPGQLVGIIGQSGSGKSTVLKILATNILENASQIIFETLENEKLEVRPDDIYSILQYRKMVSIVSQDSHIFSSSLAFNVSLQGEIHQDLIDFWDKVKNEIVYVKNWNIDLETIIKPKELSLGQKQLICALRSCFLTKPIVLFDEISSGLDSELEEALQKLVLMIQKKSLTFIVAHRIETILKADKILVMSEGKLVGQGRHTELLQNSAPYQDFITQLKGL